jgi:uncharacterized membrane protein YccC
MLDAIANQLIGFGWGVVFMCCAASIVWRIWRPAQRPRKKQTTIRQVTPITPDELIEQRTNREMRR